MVPNLKPETRHLKSLSQRIGWIPNSCAMRASFRSVMSTIAARPARGCCSRKLRPHVPDCIPLHHDEISPETLQAVRAAKQCGEDRRVGQQDVSGAFVLRRHPDQGVEFCVARLGERMWPVEINGLA